MHRKHRNLKGKHSSISPTAFPSLYTTGGGMLISLNTVYSMLYLLQLNPAHFHTKRNVILDHRMQAG